MKTILCSIMLGIIVGTYAPLLLNMTVNSVYITNIYGISIINVILFLLLKFFSKSKLQIFLVTTIFSILITASHIIPIIKKYGFFNINIKQLLIIGAVFLLLTTIHGMIFILFNKVGLKDKKNWDTEYFNEK